MVVLLDGDSQLSHQQEHFRTNVLGGVVWSNWEVALFFLNFVSQVAAFLNTTGVPASFDGVDAVERTTFGRVVADVVEQEEFRFRSEKGSISEACAVEMIESTLSKCARATLIGLAGTRFLDRADQAEGFVTVKGIHPRGARVRNHGHVRGLNPLPSTNGRAVKRQSLGEGLLFQQVCADREVLPFAVQIGELQVDKFDAFVLDLTKDVLRGFGHMGA